MKRVRLDDLSQDWQDLAEAAKSAREHAHSAYSGFAVGAAVRAGSGRVYSGCNIENAAYGLTVCAERVAIWKAVSEGERILTALALVTDGSALPCGSCRQVMREFSEDLPMVVSDLSGQAYLTRLGELLPHAFSAADLAAAGDAADADQTTDPAS